MNFPSLFRSQDPFFQLQKRMEDLITDFEKNAPLAGEWAKTPAWEAEETEKHFLFSLDLPGLKKEEIKVELKGGALTIEAERKEERKENAKGLRRSERFYGTYFQSFPVPEGVKAEEIHSEYENGVLRVAVPKKGAPASQQIPVKEANGFFESLKSNKN